MVDAVVQMCMYAEENRHHYHHLEEKHLGHCHHHHHPDVLVSFIHAFSRVAVFCISGHHLAPWLHITIMAPPLTHGHGIMDLPLFNV